ncbi:MAG: hypothetical protein IKL48_01275 [Elusimicrobiaceae bacterium]|nr:hypothetical protein [Elusimicrobiaceae bacterium]
MRKCAFILSVFVLFAAGIARAENTVLPSLTDKAVPAVGHASITLSEGAAENIQAVKEGEGFVSGTVTKSSLVTRMDFQLNDKILHTSVQDYTQPAELKEVAEKCLTADPDECFFYYKSYENSADKSVSARANLELSILSLQRGQVKQALSYINQAAVLEPEDPFIELTRGWTLFSAGKYKKARKSFADMLFLTADFEYASSAKLGTALSYYFEGNITKTAEDLQYIYTSDPYKISFASYMMGRLAAQKKSSRYQAPVFLQQSLSHDGHNYPAMQMLAQLAAKNKQNKLAAFQSYATLYSLDPADKKAKKQVSRFAKDLSGNLSDYLFFLRLDRPIVQDLPSVPSPLIKMALYANRWQEPVALQKVNVIPSGIMTISSQHLGEVLKSPSYVTRTLSFNPETKAVDFKDRYGHVEFSSRKPFTIATEKEVKTLVVKEAEAKDLFAADFSDKELKGSLTVIPQEEGMLLINHVYIEDLIPALLATQAQAVQHPQALAALAVVFRAALKEAAEKNATQVYHITDNDVYFKFKGINLTVLAMLEAVKASRGLELSGTDLGYYGACGSVSYDQVANTQNRPNYTYSPANLSKYILSSPPADLYARPDDETQWADVKWIYLYDGKDIQARLNARGKFGTLRAMTPTKLSPNGRVLAMRFTGSKGTYEAQTPQEVSYILSAGTMRSTFFDFVPMYKGKNVVRVLVRGYDSGTGVGLCVNGADGLARGGSDYQGIIKYYFPNARILDTHTGEVH